jgi:hypothetical protein
MSNIEKIILIGGDNIILYIILYVSLNAFTILVYMSIKNMIRKRKLKYKLNDIEMKLEKDFVREKLKQKIFAYIFIVIFFGFIIFVIINIYNLINKNVVYNIYGILILLSMYTSIDFYEYFKND